MTRSVSALVVALALTGCGSSSKPDAAVEDACVSQCTQGTGRCVVGGVQRCVVTAGCGAWGATRACTNGDVCPTGGTACETPDAGPGGGAGGGAGGAGGGAGGVGGGGVGGGQGDGGLPDGGACVPAKGYTNSCVMCCPPQTRSFEGFCVDAYCRVGAAPCLNDLDCCSGQCLNGRFCTELENKVCGPGNVCDGHYYCNTSLYRCFTNPTVGEVCDPDYNINAAFVGPCDFGLTCVRGADAGLPDGGLGFGRCVCDAPDAGDAGDGG